MGRINSMPNRFENETVFTIVQNYFHDLWDHGFHCGTLKLKEGH